jgi:TonB-linked SusC/RagA family outer membrane protein
VVVVGYGTQKKVNMTGAITAINTSDIETVSTTKLSNTLAGRASGVNITGNSGLIGATSSIYLRGNFYEPLFVIDGISTDKAAFDNLDASEIDQISFLKDAATAAVYGQKAGYGVVLVTTKKGTQSKPVLNYQGSYTFMNPTMELLGNQFDAIDELIYQNRVDEYRGTKLRNGETEFAYFADKNYRLLDMIWQNPWNTKHSLSVTGGNDRLTYFALASYIGEEGSFISLKDSKFNLRSNITAKITNWLKLNLNMSANQTDDKRFYFPPSTEGDDSQTVTDLYRVAFNWPQTYPLYLEADGTPANYITDYPVQTPIGTWLAWNPVDQLVGNRYIKTRKRNFNTILSLDVDLSSITKGLSTKVSANYTVNDYMRKKFLTFQTNYVWIPLNASENRFIPAPPDPNRTAIYVFNQSNESLVYGLTTNWSEQLNWQLNYNRSFGVHDVSAAVVWEQAAAGGEAMYTTAQKPLTELDQLFVYSTDAEDRSSSGNETNDGRLGWIGRFNYTYAQKYIAEFSFRYDGSVLFPKDKRWGFFPSVSAAWRINEEGFMKGIDWLNNLKIRASYGTVGSDGSISKFSYISSYTGGSTYLWGNNMYLGIQSGAVPNPNVTWSTFETWNGGLDFAVLANRLSGSLDVFKTTESDILSSRIITLPDTYGQSLAAENYAQRSWRGLDANIMWKDRTFDNQLSYSLYANIGYSKDRWDILDESATYQPGGALEELSAIGKPRNYITGYKCMGMVRTQEQLDELLSKGFKQWGRDPMIGGLYFEDIRGDGYSKGPDGKIDGNDIQLLSTNASPRINYGLGGSIEWNGVFIDAHFQGVGMYDRMISLKAGLAGIYQYGGVDRPYYPVWTGDNVWTPENPNARYPRVTGNTWPETGAASTDFWIRSGAYIRLKNLNVGYNLPKAITGMLNLVGAQIFFNGTNLFVFSPMTEFQDPELAYYESYPLMKSFTFGVNVKF